MLDRTMAESLARHALQMLGGSLIGAGFFTEQEWIALSGALMSVATAGWLLWRKARP